MSTILSRDVYSVEWAQIPDREPTKFFLLKLTCAQQQFLNKPQN